jgi:hypothetical protein
MLSKAGPKLFEIAQIESDGMLDLSNLGPAVQAK